MQTITVGPEHGSLHLHTGVEGRAARMGHRLTLSVPDWRGEVRADGDVPHAVELRAALAGLQVVKGEGGLAPVSPVDRVTIRRSALRTLQADRHPDVVFVSTDVQAAPDGWTLTGDLTVHGVTRPSTVAVAVRPDGDELVVTATAAVTQTAHGITPYSNLMGALRVADEVDVRLEARIPRP